MFTCKSIGIGNPRMDAVFEWTLPQLAFENEFLMNGILGIASLHMQRMIPDATHVRKQTDLYRVKAVQTFREALPIIDTNSSSYQAALLMALMLVILTSKDYVNEGELSIINWLVLYRGLNTVMSMSDYEKVMDTNVAEVFRRELTILKTAPVIPSILFDMVAEIGPTDPDYEGLEIYCKALDAMAPLFTCLRENGLGAPLYVRAVSWPSYLTNEFVAFAKESRPRALVILSWYLAVLKLIKGVWWVEGISDPDIDVIRKLVDPKLQKFLEVPLLVRNTSDVDVIVNLLLR
jgi:Fungal specific transcription factor domain